MKDAERSSASRRRVTSQMLLNKFQCDRERRQHREEEELIITSKYEER